MPAIRFSVDGLSTGRSHAASEAACVGLSATLLKHVKAQGVELLAEVAQGGAGKSGPLRTVLEAGISSASRIPAALSVAEAMHAVKSLGPQDGASMAAACPVLAFNVDSPVALTAEVVADALTAALTAGGQEAKCVVVRSERTGWTAMGLFASTHAVVCDPHGAEGQGAAAVIAGSPAATLPRGMEILERESRRAAAPELKVAAKPRLWFDRAAGRIEAHVLRLQ